MKIVRILFAIAIIFVGALQATSIFFTNNSKHRTDVAVQNWGMDGSYNTGVVDLFKLGKEEYPWNMYWAKDSAARRQRAFEPGEKGDLYTTEGIIKITYNPSDKVKVVGKKGEEYKSGDENFYIPKGQIWELEIQDK